MRLFTMFVIPAGLLALATIAASASAGTMMVATNDRADCGFAAFPGDVWIGNANHSSTATRESTAANPSCRSAEHHIAAASAAGHSVAMVSETATWVMMIGGFGLVGIGLRGRPRGFAH
ncbi:hypothetical protein KZX46_12410 [Polymorphobacter sp. PAMC 29334]|uniref:hypothetical protein n=1 Tax=Polymorphobacter sp. PAMC 29334 TaxID=2862331 RepID=UPI001C77C184|nr:hypothetical protein [Polymorphobacter sp. PAMC 29334]QYE33662.1 hypothetical protein KZX46_12410 [Polymorphobacter sp. PAMC 29334]